MSNPTNADLHDLYNEHLSREEPKLRLATADEPGWYTSIMLDSGEIVRHLWVTTLDGEMTKADFYRESTRANAAR